MRMFLAILAASALGAAFLVGLAPASTPGPAYLSVASFKAASVNKNAARLTVTTHAAIPRHPNAFIRANLVVGFAWVDTSTLRAFVTTIHPAIGRDSRQNPRAWHAHTVTLSTGGTAPNDFCLASIDSSPTAGISIHGATMRVNVRARVLPAPPQDLTLATGFTVQADAACASGLGVRAST